MFAKINKTQFEYLYLRQFHLQFTFLDMHIYGLGCVDEGLLRLIDLSANSHKNTCVNVYMHTGHNILDKFQDTVNICTIFLYIYTLLPFIQLILNNWYTYHILILLGI